MVKGIRIHKDSLHINYYQRETFDVFVCPENGDGRDSLTFRSDPTPRCVRIRKVQAYFSLSGFMRDCV